MSKIIYESIPLLKSMYDADQALFSFAAVLEGKRFINDFNNPKKIRYTINTLAGLQEADRYHSIGWDVRASLDQFLQKNLNQVTNPGDKGLLLYVLAKESHPAHTPLFEEIKALVSERGRLLTLNLQEICWMWLGLSKTAEKYRDESAAEACETLFRILNHSFINRDTLLAHFVQSPWRKPFTSFGGVTYFLKALYEHAQIFNDKYAETIFKEGVTAIIKLQGPKGEWPWFINVNRPAVMDWYPVYTVHQDSMAMLFLLPALDMGLPGAKGAIEKSLPWNFGANQLNQSLVLTEPFFIYRSILRSETRKKEKRYLRSLIYTATGSEGSWAAANELTINKQCRSYHIGWILYAWASRKDFKEFTDLHFLKNDPAPVAV